MQTSTPVYLDMMTTFGESSLKPYVYWSHCRRVDYDENLVSDSASRFCGSLFGTRMTDVSELSLSCKWSCLGFFLGACGVRAVPADSEEIKWFFVS